MMLCVCLSLSWDNVTGTPQGTPGCHRTQDQRSRQEGQLLRPPPIGKETLRARDRLCNRNLSEIGSVPFVARSKACL